ncbi:MAG TPA: glycine betaine/L-proline ABC transporter ATP-binding protein [Methylomusa anaerophila]|uniref:Quaternary amine transport ATP-binding protein n=1 Tax=Methylomusa anaerophila TaxID=1930071 RepID=A0A348AI56_9FIRM|nr:glycine betaine/L-proline ABC transporter ATP-binding protein [Methylomusa anaerophila]BBB90754.1 glycine betaine/carnitine transport ATP-binding protein GbuA [Methylomusa anaerophila]HML88642.1 glycine betaine/L-proline ABC transporter ATP-binding protein [Methylomusa anaerophila]
MDEILRVEHLTMLFGSNPTAALKQLEAGESKEDIQKRTGVTVGVFDASLSVAPGEIFAIIGLSGSGKSTLLRCLNLLHQPTRGQIYFKGSDITHYTKQQLMDYRRDNIAMVFQNFGLMNHRNVMGNVVYGLEIRGCNKLEREQRASEMIGLVGLAGWENHPIPALSGGMRQRVGLARALANNPDILLMDEPFSALDPIIRRDMQFELLSIQRKVKKTIVFITHDINEAFKIGNRVAIMKDGCIVQIGSPEQVLDKPADSYVENLIRDIDRTKILSVKNIMSSPSAIVKSGDGWHVAMRQMVSNGVSSVYMVNDNMQLLGLVTLDNVMNVRNGLLSMEEAVVRDIPLTSPDFALQELLPVAAEAKYPIAVTDENKQLVGIVTKAAVLSSLVS